MQIEKLKCEGPETGILSGKPKSVIADGGDLY